MNLPPNAIEYQGAVYIRQDIAQSTAQQPPKKKKKPKKQDNTFNVYMFLAIIGAFSIWIIYAAIFK